METKRIECKNVNWLCDTQDEANLADAIAAVGKANGVDENDLRYVFIHTLRMLNADNAWTRAGIQSPVLAEAEARMTAAAKEYMDASIPLDSIQLPVGYDPDANK